MTAEAGPSHLPLLAVVYGRLHVEQSLRRLAVAADGVCHILWVLHSGDPKSRMAVRLAKSEGDIEGDVVNVAGLSAEETAERIRAYAPDGITCLVDENIAWTAGIADLLGLRYYSRATAARLTDKLQQRTALRTYGLPTPDFWNADDLADPAVFASVVERARFPLVVKPRRGVASQNVSAVRSEAELRAAIERAEPGTMLVETFIPNPTVPAVPAWNAPFVSVEVLASRGRIGALGVTGRFPLADRFQETGQIFPAAVSPQTRDALVEAAIGAVRAMGVENGILHVEVKWTDAGPMVIEVNGRLGGGRVDDFLRGALHADFVRESMRLALGEDLAYDDALDAPTGVGFVLWVHAGPGIRRVTSVEGVAAVEAIPGVEKVGQNVQPGEAVDWGLGTLGNVLTVSGSAADYETVRHIRERALSAIVISGTEEA